MKTKTTITEIAEKLKTVKSALIFSHVRPDGDTLGSAAALKHALEKFGVECRLVCPSEIPQKFSFLSINENYTKLPDNARFDVHIAVDCSTEEMLGDYSTLFQSCKNTFNIDHHISNSLYAKYNYVCDRAANCENIYELITELFRGEEDKRIDERIATEIMLGIVTDTGAFAHSNVTENTLEVAAVLKKAGADLHEIVYKLFKEQKLVRARLFALVISGMKIYHDGKLAVISVRKTDFEKTGASTDMTEGFIDFPLSVEGVEVAVSIMETGDKKFKLSFRSKGTANVNEIASRFGGGGHILASGCMLNGYYEDVVDKIVFTVGNYL